MPPTDGTAQALPFVGFLEPLISGSCEAIARWASIGWEVARGVGGGCVPALLWLVASGIIAAGGIIVAGGMIVAGTMIVANSIIAAGKGVPLKAGAADCAGYRDVAGAAGCQCAATRAGASKAAKGSMVGCLALAGVLQWGAQMPEEHEV